LPEKKKSKKSSRYILRAGYLLAVPPLFVIARILKKPGDWPNQLFLLSEFLGMVLITLGWISRKRPRYWIINGSWLVSFSVLWLRASRKGKAKAV